MNDKTPAPIAAVIATRSRAVSLRRMLASLGEQSLLPAEVIVVDASADTATKHIVAVFAADIARFGCRVTWLEAECAGAAIQRNQGFARATQAVVGFFDDDIVFHDGCLSRLYAALASEQTLGGVNAMIANQCYCSPGLVSRTLFRIMAGEAARSYGGRVVGPAVNLLPEDAATLPDVVAVDWLNTTCTLYRREALPQPPFAANFAGYSMMEDLALSLTVARQWKLANVRSARIDHLGEFGAHKADAAALSRMELVNRHYIMTAILARRRLRDYGKLLLWEAFQLASCAVEERGGRKFWRMLWGKLLAVRDLAAASAAKATA